MMIYPTVCLAFMLLHWQVTSIDSSVLDGNLILSELSNDIKKLGNKFEGQVKEVEEIMEELRGEENFLLSTLIGQQKALENKIDVMGDSQDQIKRTQGEMKQYQGEIKLTLENMTLTQGQMKLSQDVMKQQHQQMKETQNDMIKTLNDSKQEQSKTKEQLIQIKQTQNEIKDTEDKNHEKINLMFDAIKKLPCEVSSLQSLNTQIINGKRYYFSADQPKTSWYDSEKFCKSHCMQLFSVETQQELNDLMPEVVKLQKKFDLGPWSSGSDAAQEGKWVWTATGTDVVLYGKIREMTNTTNQNCLYLNTAGWGDAPCSNKYTFICEQNIL